MVEQRYHPVARYLHWLVAALVILQFVLAKLAEFAATPAREVVLQSNHRSVGITILVLAVVRLAWRQYQGVPRPLPVPAWQAVAAKVSHWLMYGLIVVLPVSGWLMSSAAASAVSWFGLIPVPHLVTADPGLAATLESVHGSLAWLLLSLAVIHIGAALKHSLLDKFGAIARITSAGPMLAFVAVIVGGVTMLVPGDQGPTSYARRAAETSPLSEPPVWAIDYESSFIRFTVTEKGNSVGGELTDWTAEIRFDEANLEASLIDAILATSVAERDAALPESERMDSDNPPTARFHASSFRRGPDGGFAAAGVLTVEGRQSPALLAFTVERGNDRTILDGTALLDGRALPANSAESADTGPAGRDVPVVVHIETLDQRASPN